MKWWIIAFIINVQGEYGHIEYKREFNSSYVCKSYFMQNSKTIMTGLQSKLNKDPDEWFIQHIGCLPTDKVIELNKNTKERHDSI